MIKCLKCNSKRFEVMHTIEDIIVVEVDEHGTVLEELDRDAGDDSFPLKESKAQCRQCGFEFEGWEEVI